MYLPPFPITIRVNEQPTVFILDGNTGIYTLDLSEIRDLFCLRNLIRATTVAVLKLFDFFSFTGAQLVTWRNHLIQ